MTASSSNEVHKRSRLRRALLDGLFGAVFALAVVGVLLAFIALYFSGQAGLIACIVTALVGFAAGATWSWRARSPAGTFPSSRTH